MTVVGTQLAYSGFYANKSIRSDIKLVLLLAFFLAPDKLLAMKLKLTEAQRAIFKLIGKAGGLAGNHEKKRTSALKRWARTRKSISRTSGQ